MPDAVLPLLAGEEAGGVACKAYQCTVSVLLLLAGRILDRELELEPAVAAAEHVATLVETSVVEHLAAEMWARVPT